MDAQEREKALSRFKAYQAKYQQMRESNASSEFVEREMLLDFMRLNEPLFSDLPKNRNLQVSVIDLICLRSYKNARFKNFHNILLGFMTDIGRFGKLDPVEDEKVFERTVNLLVHSEKLLVKFIQSVIRVQAGVIGGLSGLIEELYGESGRLAYKEYAENIDFSHAFWRGLFELFIKSHLDNVYNRIVTKSRYTFSRTKSRVVLCFPFDTVLEEMGKVELGYRKKRKLSHYVETAVEEFAYKRTKQVVSKFLAANSDFFFEDMGQSRDIEPITEIVCFDEVAGEYKDSAVKDVLQNMQLGDLTGFNKEILKENEAFELLKAQLLALALGSAIAYDTVQKDFIQGLQVFSAKNMQVFSERDIESVDKSIRYFELESLEWAMIRLIDMYFHKLLVRKCLDKKDKITVERVEKRRVDMEVVDELLGTGLSRIQKNKIFRPDPAKEGWFVFRGRDFATIEGYFNLLMLEDYLRERLETVWLAADMKIEYYVLINLPRISRSAMDLKKGLTEILYKYGIQVN